VSLCSLGQQFGQSGEIGVGQPRCRTGVAFGGHTAGLPSGPDQRETVLM